ncbi:MAG: hypothetical protein GX078_01960 [Clostridiales bacterium]|nr:hypothetical protein [Clostridiales bacterium]
MTLLFATTTFTAYAADDVTGLITNKNISVIQNGNVIGEGDTITSLDPITINISFEAPLIGDDESDHVLQGDTATFPVAEGFSLNGDPGIYNDMPLVYDGYDIGHISLIEDPTGIINANIVFDGDTQVFDGSQGWSEYKNYRIPRWS